MVIEAVYPLQLNGRPLRHVLHGILRGHFPKTAAPLRIQKDGGFYTAIFTGIEHVGRAANPKHTYGILVAGLSQDVPPETFIGYEVTVEEQDAALVP